MRIREKLQGFWMRLFCIAMTLLLQLGPASCMAQSQNTDLAKLAFKVFSADINGDGQVDLLVKVDPKIIIIPIDDDLIVPISVPSQISPFILLSSSNGSYVLQNKPDGSLLNYTGWQSGAYQIATGSASGADPVSLSIKALNPGTPSFEVALFPDKTFQLVFGPGVTFFHNDVSGTPLLASDANGNVLWKENYRPYGSKINNEAASSSNSLWFAGKPYDNSTGLSYIGARYYDPAVGRFMGVDPKAADPGDIHSVNRYSYANNNPYKFVDPDGHSPIDVAFLAYDIGKLSVALYTGVGVGPAIFDFGASVVGVVSPIPMAGQAMKAARVAEHGVALARQAEHGVEAARAAKSLGNRVEEVHGVLHPIAQRRRTTAGLETAEGTRVLASGGRDLSPAQRGALMAGEEAGKLRGAHAEVTALQHAAEKGLTPSNMEVSRRICPACAAEIEKSGGRLTSPTTAEWGR